VNINATLFVQAFHFFIAYIILRKLFFAPALAELEAEKREKQQLDASIEGVKHSLEKKQQTRDAQWREVQEFYLHNKPQLDESELFFFRDITPELTVATMTHEERDALISQTSSALTDKIKKIYHV